MILAGPRVFRPAIWWFVLSAVMVSGPTWAAESETPPSPRWHVLFLNSYHPGYVWGDTVLQTVRRDLTEGRDDVELHVEYMDAKRIEDPKFHAQLAELYRWKFQHQPLDAIIASDNNALEFLLQYRDDVFPNVPVVFCGINDFHPDMLRGHKGYTGVTEILDFEGTLGLALRLHPKTRRIFACTDTTKNGRIDRELFIQAMKKVAPKLPFEIYDIVDLPDLYKKVDQLPADAILFISSTQRDRAGRLLSPVLVARQLAQRAHCPSYACVDFLIGTGVVGGCVNSAPRQGEEAARIARLVLEGTPPQDIPIVASGLNQVIFDARAMERFGLSENDLPPDAVVRFTQPQFYLRHRRIILTGGVVFGGMLLIIVALLAIMLRRRRVEYALRTRESRWRMLYEGLPGYSFLVNEQKTIEDVNDALCDLTGYRREELIGRPCSVLCLRASDACPVLQDRENLTNVEDNIRARDGRIIPILRSAKRVPLGRRQVVIENFQNLSARKEAEEALRKSEENERSFREKLAALNSLIVDLTGATSLDDLCRQAVELAHAKLGFERIGIWFKTQDPDFVIGSFGIDEQGRVRDERKQRLKVAGDSMIREALEENGPKTLYFLRTLRNHLGQPVGKGPNAVSTIWNGQEVVGYISVDTLLTGREITDIEQRLLTLFASSLANLLTRQTMERERSRLAEAVEQAAEAFVITDLEGRIQYVNQGLTKMLGFSTTEVLGRDIEWLYTEDSKQLNESAPLESMRRAMRSGQAGSERMSGQKKDAPPVDIEATFFPIRDRQGVILNFTHILRDVSKESQLEAQLRQATKMEAIGRLAGGIAHDFNNQLTVVRGYCDLLLRDLKADNPIREFIEQIDHATRQASTLTSELLSFSRKQILKPQVVSPNQIIRNIAKSLSMIGEHIELELHLAEDAGNVRVDPNRLEQAVMNLTLNARDAMPNGGRLTIGTTNVDLEEDYISVSPAGRNGPHVAIVVQDTGIGMSQESLEQIFEPFFSTKDKGKGTGLGLSMVYGFVQQSQGHIEVDSGPGAGTTFRIFLPRVEAELEPEKPVKAVVPVQKGQQTVLVVEDDPSVRKLVVRVLEEYGYRLLETGVPEEAHKLVEDLDRPLDLLITDVVMPGTNGPELARQLQKKQPDLRILFISGYTEERTLRKEIDSARVHFLHKPFAPDELSRAVTQALTS